MAVLCFGHHSFPVLNEGKKVGSAGDFIPTLNSSQPLGCKCCFHLCWFNISWLNSLGGGGGEGLLLLGDVSAFFHKNLPDAFQGGQTTFTSIHSFCCPALPCPALMLSAALISFILGCGESGEA